MAYWQDPRLGIYKSALQKAIRRGEVDRAVSAAAVLLEVPGGRSALIRRLSVIAAEDVGSEWIPAVVALAKAQRRASDPGALDAAFVGAAAALASLPKDKVAYWLAATCWEGRARPSDVSTAGLTAALDRGDYRDAVAVYMAARDRREWRSGPRLIDAILGRLRVGPVLARAIGEAALWREGQGGFGIDELAAAAVIAAIDGLSGPDRDLPVVALPAPGPALPLAWWVFDSHSAVGARVLARFARRLGLPTRSLTDLMFNCSSLELGPIEVPARWKDAALQMDAELDGWASHAEAHRLWREIRDEVRHEIEREVATDPTLRRLGVTIG